MCDVMYALQYIPPKLPLWNESSFIEPVSEIDSFIHSFRNLYIISSLLSSKQFIEILDTF